MATAAWRNCPLSPLICRLKKAGPIILHPKHKFDPHIGEIREFVRSITPDSLHSLKALVGVPNEVALKEQRGIQTARYMRKVQMQDLPAESKVRFKALDYQARTAVTDMAHNLLHGYVEDDRVKRQPYKSVVDYMLERAKGPSHFYGE